MMAAYIERDERCLFIGNLDSRVTEEILWELFLQVQKALLNQVLSFKNAKCSM